MVLLNSAGIGKAHTSKSFGPELETNLAVLEIPLF